MLITLTTDFGLQDHYVAAMKGVILTRCPSAEIIDICHQIPAFSILAGAYTLHQAVRYFPPAVHVVVVDPGVGTERRAIAVQADQHTFVAPDNGVLSLVLKRARQIRAHVIENESLFVHPLSRTFHGRDVFAPVGAALASGTPISETGREISDIVTLPELSGSAHIVLSIDSFGNIVTNIPAETFRPLNSIALAGKLVGAQSRTFGQAPPNTPFIYAGSSGYIEIGINGASAANYFGIRIGDKVEVR